MPSKKVGDAEYRDIAHPINAKMRQIVQEAVIDAYEKALNNENEE